MNHKQNFTEGSIFGKMLQFMLPILGAQILQAMYGAVDMLIVGHFGTNAGISAVSTGSSITSILFSFLGYFNGHGRSMFVMLQGLAQSFLIRLPMSYIMSIQPNASLTGIGLAAPTATLFGIALCLIYYRRMRRQIP